LAFFEACGEEASSLNPKPDVKKRIREEAGRAHTAAANKARQAKHQKAEPIGKIIEGLRDKLWENEKFKGNIRGTAATIFPGLNGALATMPDRPKKWPVLDLKDGNSEKTSVRKKFEKQKRLAIQRIEPRLRRL
jgi:hypothetical protein